MGEALSGLTSSPGHEFSSIGPSSTGLSNWNDTIVAATTMLVGTSAADMQMATAVSSSVVRSIMIYHTSRASSVFIVSYINNIYV
ncbi:hypothetical protein [Rickettsia endosymbiont of Ixodes scapularis]|nr:hypothetical protein [Rickettsia endosymbiont of Ixodes scapularis]